MARLWPYLWGLLAAVLGGGLAHRLKLPIPWLLGSLLTTALLTLRGRSLQQAAIEAKIYNLLTNLVALALFLARGQVVWSLGLAMALGQVLGARLASRLLLLRGNKLIRPMAITVSLLMSLVLAKRYWFS